MDLKILSQLIKELLVENDRISLPGIGSFVTEIAPAFFSEDGETINPPSRKLLFKSSEVWDDGLIVKHYADKFVVSQAKASKELDVFFSGLRVKVDAKKSLVFPEIGKLRSTLEGNLFFITDPDVDFNTGLMGLDSISLKDLSSVSSTRDITHNFKEEEFTAAPRDIKYHEKEYKAKNGRPGIEIFLWISVVILVLLLLSMVFRQEIGSFFESLLYSPQDLEFLKQLE